MLEGVREWLSLEGYYLLKRTKAKYYIICRTAGGAGFFSNYMWVLGHAVFACKLGYIPVVDMENYPTLYSEEGLVGYEKNAWNYYFENIGRVSLQDAYREGNYIKGKDLPLHKYAEKYCEKEYRFPTPRAVSYYAPFIEKNIRIRAELKMEFEVQWREKVTAANRVLGIHIRGTDMKNNLGHPMPAPVETYIEKTKEILKTYPEIDRVFLATDENDVKIAFETAFEEREELFFMNKAFRTWDTDCVRKTGIHELKVENARPFHKYLLGREVLQDAWFLSRCDYLICGHSNISNTAILWNHNRYKQIICV